MKTINLNDAQYITLPFLGEVKIHHINQPSTGYKNDKVVFEIMDTNLPLQYPIMELIVEYPPYGYRMVKLLTRGDTINKVKRPQESWKELDKPFQIKVR